MMIIIRCIKRGRGTMGVPFFVFFHLMSSATHLVVVERNYMLLVTKAFTWG